MTGGVGASFPGDFFGSGTQLCWVYIFTDGSWTGQGVGSVQKVSSGKYTVFWSRAFSNDKYCVVATVGVFGGNIWTVDAQHGQYYTGHCGTSAGATNGDVSIIAIGFR